MKIVVALGGNALRRRGEAPEASLQQAHVAEAAIGLASLARDHEVIITHGNGPQVGLLAVEAENYREITPYPLDVLGAESQGMIGYLLQNALAKHIPERSVATVLTRVEVSATDQAFNSPTKPIGSVYNESDAHRLAAERGWRIAPDGKAWRRVVPSPEPRSIVELNVIKVLVAAGIVVIAAGGGGIPVVRDHDALRGAEAVIDKDLTASLLALELGAEMLVVLTDVPGVAIGWRTPSQAYVARASTESLRSLSFASGSMAPKVEACIRFVDRSGAPAVIGDISDAALLVSGSSGTRIVSGRDPIEFREAA